MSAGNSTTVRVPDDQMARASALVGPVEETKPGLRAGTPGARLTRAAVYRLAAHRGMEQLERETRRDLELMEMTSAPVAGGTSARMP